MNEIYFERILKAFDFEKVESTSETSIPFYIFHNIAIYYDKGACITGKIPLEVLDNLADNKNVRESIKLINNDNGINDYIPLLSSTTDKLEAEKEKLLNLSGNEKKEKIKDIVIEFIRDSQNIADKYVKECSITSCDALSNFLIEMEAYYSKKQGIDYDRKRRNIEIAKNILDQYLDGYLQEAYEAMFSLF